METMRLAAACIDVPVKKDVLSLEWKGEWVMDHGCTADSADYKKTV